MPALIWPCRSGARLDPPALSIHALRSAVTPCLACLAVPSPAPPSTAWPSGPCLPCYALPLCAKTCHTMTRLPCLSLSHKVSPGQVVPAVRCPAGPHHIYPGLDGPSLPYLTTPSLVEPCRSVPCLPCFAGPELSVRCRDSTSQAQARLPRPAPPGRKGTPRLPGGPRLPCPTSPVPAPPRAAKPRHAFKIKLPLSTSFLRRQCRKCPNPYRRCSGSPVCLRPGQLAGQPSSSGWQRPED